MAKNRTLRQSSVQAVFTKQKTTPKSGLVINLKFVLGKTKAFLKVIQIYF
jgi:hypothetical protein